MDRCGTGAAPATVARLATLSMILPTFTIGKPGPEFSSAQLGFAAVASLLLHGLFVAVQTVRHREYFLPLTQDGRPRTDVDDPALLPGRGATALSGVLTVVVGALTVVPGRATLLQSGVHLVIFAAFVFLAISP